MIDIKCGYNKQKSYSVYCVQHGKAHLQQPRFHCVS